MNKATGAVILLLDSADMFVATLKLLNGRLRSEGGCDLLGDIS